MSNDTKRNTVSDGEPERYKALMSERYDLDVYNAFYSAVSLTDIIADISIKEPNGFLKIYADTAVEAITNAQQAIKKLIEDVETLAEYLKDYPPTDEAMAAAPGANADR